MLDSQAAFRARAKEIGLNDGEIAVLTSESHDTFGTFAFACNYVPGQADEGPLWALAAKMTATDPAPPARIPFIRRLVFEAYTLAASDLKSRVERRDDDALCKLAVAERAARHTVQANRLRGLTLRGELEPSNALIDLVTQQVEDNQLRYVRWEQRTKRDQELMGIKSDPVWKPDSTGVIKEVKLPSDLKADLTSDLMLRLALQRRSLAYDQTRIIDYDAMEEWSQILLEAYVKPAPDGCSKVSIEQVHKADLEMFKHMMRATRTGVKIRSDGTKPLEEAFREAKVAPDVRLILQHLPETTGTKRKADDGQESKQRPKGHADVEKYQRQIRNLQGQVKNLQAKSKGKGKSASMTESSKCLGSSSGSLRSTRTAITCALTSTSTDATRPTQAKDARRAGMCAVSMDVSSPTHFRNTAKSRDYLQVRVKKGAPASMMRHSCPENRRVRRRGVSTLLRVFPSIPNGWSFSRSHLQLGSMQSLIQSLGNPILHVLLPGQIL